MKPILPLCFGLTLTVSTFAPPVSAQNALQPAPKNGYETLIEAGKLVLPGENGGPSSPDANLSPQENLRRERVAVARNAPALKMLREALKMPVSAPLPQSYADSLNSAFGRFRELARQLRQESDVRLADGDFAGALDSRLTILELGAAITRGGPFIDSLVGMAIESIARKDIEPIAAQLDAAQLRAALSRLKTLDARRPTFGEIFTTEKKTTLQLTTSNLRETLAAEAERKRLGQPEPGPDGGFNQEELRETLALTPETLTAQIAPVFDAVIARSQLTYRAAFQTEVPPAPSSLAKIATDLYRDPKTRFSYENNRTANRLLEAALELRALKLETGAYPLTFNVPIDPFSDQKPLIYRRDGEKYRLYSVGPDGRDDGGAALETIVTNEQNGIKSLSNRPSPDAAGDISAPIFG